MAQQRSSARPRSERRPSAAQHAVPDTVERVYADHALGNHLAGHDQVTGNGTRAQD